MDCGPEVTKVKRNDHVVLTWIKGNGIDVPSTQYKRGSQSVNSGAISTFMHHAVISENRLVPIPKNVPLNEAALFGCAIPTGAGIVFNDLKIEPYSTVAVFGVGGIGASAIFATHLQHPRRLIAVDRDLAKLKFAQYLGATHAIHTESQNVVDTILEITEGKGVDYSIEAAGVKQAMETAFRIVKDRGGTCVIAGNAPKGCLIECDPFDLIKGKRLIGSWGGGIHPDQDIPSLIDRFYKSSTTPSPEVHKFISDVKPLYKINEAIQLMNNQKAARILIKCAE
jgi:S-(hydroxymethyl)glutathione dehydrogenase/alcohol dehydrogenase